MVRRPYFVRRSSTPKPRFSSSPYTSSASCHTPPHTQKLSSNFAMAEFEDWRSALCAACGMWCARAGLTGFQLARASGTGSEANKLINKGEPPRLICPWRAGSGGGGGGCGVASPNQKRRLRALGLWV